MKALRDILKEHGGAHAYLVRSNNLGAAKECCNELSELGLVNAGSPDVYRATHDVFGVSEARALSQFASLKPIGEKKYLLLSARSMTTEAQSALLKVVEEGVGHSVFFFFIAPGVPVLSTLQSRCVVVKDFENTLETSLAEEFLALPLKDRLSQAEKFGKDSDREGARELVRSLLAIANEKEFNKKQLRDLLEADQFLQLSGSSPKGIIGHLSLAL